MTTAAEGVSSLIKDVDIVKTSEARRRIEVDADRLLTMVGDLPPTIRPPHLNLLEQVEAVHPSSLAASISRSGDWENFQMDHILGVGVRIDANIRTRDHLKRIEHKLQELEAEHGELRDVVESIEAIRAGVADGRQEFLASALAIGRDAFRTLLSKHTETFSKARDRYGAGQGYKRDVASYWKEFFEGGAHATAQGAIDSRLQRSWEQNVIVPLRMKTRVRIER